MRTIPPAISLCILLASGAPAFADLSGSFFCNAEASGGVNYDDARKKWTGATFIPGDHFVLKITALQKSMRKDFSGKETPHTTYSVTTTDQGRNTPHNCRQRGRDASEGDVILNDAFDGFACSTGFEEFRINLKHNRFLRAYLIGYVLGEDNNDNTPSISIGRCTRID